MIVRFHTPQGTIEVDSETLTDPELDRLGYFHLRRALELLGTSPSIITPPDMHELLNILAVWIGLKPPPTP